MQNRTMKSKGLWVVAGSTCITVLLTTGILVVARRTSDVVVVRAAARMPFTAVAVSKQYDEGGSLRVVRSTLHAAREDGSYVDVHMTQNDRDVMRRVVVDLPARIQVTVDPTSNSKATYPLSNAWVRNIQSRTSCPESLSGDRDNLLGFEVVKVSIEHRSAAFVERRQEWLAPALDCYPLRSESVLVRGGQDGPRTVTEVVSVTRGVIDPSLFVVEPGYTERQPSEAMVEAARKAGKPCTECAPAGAGNLDSVYRRAQGR